VILADILKRWHVLQGKPAILCTGTDEHGMKIQEAAARARINPRDFCDNGAETFKSLVQRAGLSNYHFVRTTDQEHKDAVQHVWKKLWDKGYIYSSKHEGWYSISDETFYPESAIEKRLDPFSGRTFMASSETGKEVEWTSEANYHFPLKAFKDRLLEFYKQNPHFVVPESRMQNVIDWVTHDLKDLSISRPVERLKWGIRVPGDETQTIYVWLDALVNYITKAGYPWESGNETAGGWPADVQVIGKDIVRFHCIYWPAFLLALDITPPKQILTHAHWTMGNEKMSKSTGNVVNPFFAIDRFGIDTMRFYLAHEGGIEHDSNYSNEHIATIYKKNLLGGVGGLLSRVTRTKTWNVRRSVEAAPFGDHGHWNRFTKAQRKSVEGLRSSVTASFVELNPSSALRRIVQVIHEVCMRHVFSEAERC
jgi:methionyl-tRNA synthetase